MLNTANLIYLAYIPSPPQGVWQLGPLTLRAYALCIMTGIIAAILWSRVRYRDLGGDPAVVLDCAIIIIPAGIIGGRTYHVLTDYYRYFGPNKEWTDIFKLTNGGLGIWGAVALGTLCVWLYMRYKKLNFGTLAAAAAPPLILAQAIGRVGNWFNQELYGGPLDKPWALEIFQRVNRAGKLDMMNGHSNGTVIALVQPTFLYEIIWNILIMMVLLYIQKRFSINDGRLFVLYVMGYTFGRFFIELMRTDSATEIMGFRINSWVSLIVFLLATVLFIVMSRKKNKSESVGSEKSSSVPE